MKVDSVSETMPAGLEAGIVTFEEYDMLRHRPGAAGARVSVPDGHDRTLLYGYDVERRTWHVYKKDGVIKLVVYTHQGDLVSEASGTELEAASLVPNKRLYPEACDRDFCVTLQGLGVHLPFTTYDLDRPTRDFHGKTFDSVVGLTP